MSGGGIPKDKNKPRKAGEMSYNECLAEWHRMQRAEQAKQQDKVKNLEALNAYKEINSKIADKISAFKEGFMNFKNSIDSMPKIVQLPLKALALVAQPFVNLISKIPNVIKAVENFVVNTAQFINSVAEKLSSFLGEIKNFIQEKITNFKDKKILKTLLSLFVETKGEEEKENEEVQKLKLKEMKKLFKGIFRRKENKKRKKSKR